MVFSNAAPRIVLSKAGPEERYIQYIQWLAWSGPDYEYIDLSSVSGEQVRQALDSSCGLVLTGGVDVFPGYYGMESLAGLGGPYDQARDAREIEMISEALQLGLPILAICRGAQLLNAAMGGDLIPDIPSRYPTSIRHNGTFQNPFTHGIEIAADSMLMQLIGVTSGQVNSFHHQAVGKLAPGFIAAGSAPDGIIEAYTWAAPAGKPFLLAVQWHPERLAFSDPFSHAIASAFLMECKSYFLRTGSKA